jgi:hypothetical protein
MAVGAAMSDEAKMSGMTPVALTFVSRRGGGQQEDVRDTEKGSKTTLMMVIDKD